MPSGGLTENDLEKWLRPMRQKDGSVLWFPVTHKERLFIQCYIRTLNHEKSARFAGFPGKSEFEVDQRGRTTLGQPYIRAIVDNEFRKMLASEEEVVGRLKEQIAASSSDFFKEVQRLLPDGTLETVREFDWDYYKSHGHLVREMVMDGQKVTIKLYDAQKALELVGRHKRLFTETLDISQTGEVIVKVVKGIGYEEL